MRNLLLHSLVIFLLVGMPTWAFAALKLKGQFIQGGLIQGRVGPGDQVVVGQRQIRVSADGRFIIGFGRDAPLRQTLALTHADGSVENREIDIQQRTYDVQRINGIDKRMMEPTEEDLRRISHEAELVTEARQLDSAQDHFSESFVWPVVGRISGIYGSQRIFNGEPRRPHYGVDIAAAKGTPVIAPAGGTVVLVHQGMFFSGATLIIDHGHGLSSSFLHLNSILVKAGEQVAQGQRIATVGASGRVTGPHLDWRVNWFDVRLDPALLVPGMTENGPRKSQ